MPSRIVAVLEVVSVGFPFCAFKVLTGLIFFAMPYGAALGVALIALGLVDAALNLINLAGFVFGRDERLVSACVLHRITRAIRPADRAWDELGLSLDTMLSFALVAVVIGGGLLVHLAKPALDVWSVSVVMNVLGAGLGRLTESLRKI